MPARNGSGTVLNAAVVRADKRSNGLLVPRAVEASYARLSEQLR